MQTKIVLISDNSDFFEYVVPKLNLRKSDEIFRFKFSELPEKIHLLSSSVLIIDSSNNNEQTLQLLDIVEDVPCIIFGYNNDEKFVLETYKKGAGIYIALSASEDEINAKIIPALKIISSANKSALYRKILVNNNLITGNNEVFLDFTNILESEIDNIKKNAVTSTLVAIAPDEKSKYAIQPNLIETVILNNIRKNDILMSYSYNKYFLLLNNIDKDNAIKIWSNIKSNLSDGVYAGFASVGNKSRQQVVNEVLSALHNAMTMSSPNNNPKNTYEVPNFKVLRNEFNKKILQVVSPVFYHIEQKYNDKLFGIIIQHDTGDNYGMLSLKTETCEAVLRLSNSGISTVSIDITYKYNDDSDNILNLKDKHITLSPDELEEGFLQDLLEEFINEFKNAADEAILQ